MYPPKYKKSMAKDLPKYFEKGESVAEVAVRLGISKKTFYEWLKDKPEFAQAYEMAKTISESWWIKAGRAATMGQVPGFAPTPWIFNMKNRFGWKDNPGETPEQNQPPVIHIHTHPDKDSDG